MSSSDGVNLPPASTPASIQDKSETPSGPQHVPFQKEQKALDTLKRKLEHELGPKKGAAVYAQLVKEMQHAPNIQLGIKTNPSLDGILTKHLSPAQIHTLYQKIEALESGSSDPLKNASSIIRQALEQTVGKSETAKLLGEIHGPLATVGLSDQGQQALAQHLSSEEMAAFKANVANLTEHTNLPIEDVYNKALARTVGESKATSVTELISTQSMGGMNT